MNDEQSTEQHSNPARQAPAQETPGESADKPTPKRRRSRTQAGEEQPAGDVFEQVIADARTRQMDAAQAAQASSSRDGNGQTEEYKLKWLDRFEVYVDDDAGVKVREDRKNKRMTIALRSEPPADVTDMLRDGEWIEDCKQHNTWHKHIDDMRPGDPRDEARRLAFKAANLIRAEEGLPLKRSYYSSREGYGSRG